MLRNRFATILVLAATVAAIAAPSASAGAPSVSEIVVTKASPAKSGFRGGVHVAPADLDGDGGGSSYLRIKLQDCIVSS